jgi:hypothetical protein
MIGRAELANEVMLTEVGLVHTVLLDRAVSRLQARADRVTTGAKAEIRGV